MSRLKFIAIAAAILVGAVCGVPGGVASAAEPTEPKGLSPAEQMQGGLNDISGSEAGSNKSLLPTVKTGINIFLFIIGALAVVMIIYGGFKYVVSRGESADVTSAKNTIVYALVGLVVATLAYAIVNFVVDRL